MVKKVQKIKKEKIEKQEVKQEEVKKEEVKQEVKPEVKVPEQKSAKEMSPEELKNTLKKAGEGIPPLQDLSQDPVIAKAMATTSVTKADLIAAYVFADKVMLVTSNKGKISVAR